MADINSPLEIPVTTGPLPGSRKIHVAGTLFPNIRVAMREVALDPSAKEEPVRIYDCSGPYTDPEAHIDINAGLPQLRRDWIMARGDVEAYDGREIKPEDNGQLGPDRSGGVPQFPNAVKRPLRAKAGMNVSQIYDRVASTLMQTMIAQWIFWVPVQVINFKFTPVRYQVWHSHARRAQLLRWACV